MAGIPEINGRLRSEDTDGKNPPEGSQDKVDSLVSHFLQELSGLSAEIKPVQPAPIEAERPAGKIPIVETEQPLTDVTPEPVPLKEEAAAPQELDAAAIDKEIDATLAELERQKSTVVPISDRRISVPEPVLPPSRNLHHPSAAPSAPMAAKQTARPAQDAPEPGWQGLEVFRSELASSKSGRSHKTIYFALAAVLLMAILLYFFLAKSGKLNALFAQSTSPDLCLSSTYEINPTGIKPGYPIAG